MSSAPQHSLAEIQAAIEALMSRLSGGRTSDTALAGRIAGSILPTVNDARNPVEALNGPAFDRLVIEQAPKLAETVNDPAAKLAAAKAEEARANVSGAPISDAARAALFGNTSQGTGAARGASGDRAEYAGRAAASADLGSITTQNYSGSHYASAGLSFDSFNAMRRDGFSGTQIISAVNTNKVLGISANDDPAATARLQRDTPWAVESLKESHDALKDANSCDEKAKQAKAKGDTAAAERWRKQGETKRQEEAERHRRTHDRLGREKPERQGDYDNRYQRMRDGLRGIKTGNEHEDRATLHVIENYRRHPDDAAARRQYEALNKKLSADPRRKLAMAKIDKTLHEGQKAEVAEVKNTEVEKTKGDDGLAFLNEEPATAKLSTTAQATQPKPKKPDEEKSRLAGTPASGKLAQSKPAVPTA